MFSSICLTVSTKGWIETFFFSVLLIPFTKKFLQTQRIFYKQSGKVAKKRIFTFLKTFTLKKMPVFYKLFKKGWKISGKGLSKNTGQLQAQTSCGTTAFQNCQEITGKLQNPSGFAIFGFCNFPEIHRQL